MDPHCLAIDRCRAFIDSNFVKQRPLPKRPRLAVALSREAFSDSHAIAEEMIQLLQKENHTKRREWALFDRDLVEKVLEDHHLPKLIGAYMPEDRDHNVTGLINEILGLHPSQWELFHHTCDTILKLAKVGNVIIIGRGAHVLTRHLPHVLRVRIVAPREERIARAMKRLEVSHGKAARRVRHEDAAREAYVRSHFDESLTEPLAYHLTLNSGGMSAKQAAGILTSALLMLGH